MQNFGSSNVRRPPKQKKGFLIDKITEDSFYENLLLGLTTVLKSCQFVSQIKLERFFPATAEEVAFWEFTNCTHLPESLRNLYQSSNGFSLSYKFQYDKDDPEEVCHVIGSISINPLSKLERISTEETWYMTETGRKITIPDTKIFVLTQAEENSCVVMATFNPTKPLSFWLYYKMKNFFFLCDDFVTYFRMAVAHLGVPGWQLAVLKSSLPEWSLELFQILAPGLLHPRQPLETQMEINQLDPNIFNENFDNRVVTDRSYEEEGKKKSLKSVRSARKK